LSTAKASTIFYHPIQILHAKLLFRIGQLDCWKTKGEIEDQQPAKQQHHTFIDFPFEAKNPLTNRYPKDLSKAIVVASAF